MQYQKHTKAREILKCIDNSPEQYLIIHYACESFYDTKDGHSPRIATIAVYNFSNAQTDSFSVHKIAEKRHVDFNDIETNFDILEKQMLDEFFTFAKEHQNYYWIHWNMRDGNYGFAAIEHRYLVLGGEPFKIPDSNKIDLARLFINCYGVGYIGNPRMEKLLLKNDIKAKDFLNGQQEAEAFKHKEYVKLHMSTLRKVDVFANLINRSINNKLKVNSGWREIYGVSVQGIVNYCKDTWWIQLIWTGVTFVLGVLLSEKIKTLFS